MDIVYTFVNSDDNYWFKEYEKHYRVVRALCNDSASKNRFNAQLNEIYYSIKSISKLVKTGIINNIYIVVSSLSQISINTKLNEMIELTNNKLIIIPHSMIMPLDVLPTFNSLSIELYLHKIPNLTESFIYFNDDIIVNDVDTFGEHIKESIQYNKNIIYFSDQEIGQYLEHDEDWGSYQHCLNSSVGLIKQLYKGKIYRLEHAPYFLTKSLLEELRQKFELKCRDTSKSKFRKKTDICLTAFIYQYYAISLNHAIIKDDEFTSAYIDVNKCVLPIDHRYLFISLQDDYNGDEVKYREMKDKIKNFLDKL